MLSSNLLIKKWVTFFSTTHKINRYNFFVLVLVGCFMTSACSSAPSSQESDDDPEFVQDVDQNSYSIVWIGNQLWMEQNLRTTSYGNGDAIPEVRGQADWIGLTTGAWVRYQHLVSNDFDFGKLYNWTAVSDSRGLCPNGWKVPTDNDWKTLERHLGMSAEESDNSEIGRGGEQNVGGKMKSTTLWDAPNEGATNESGLDAGPGGMRHYETGLFDLVDKKGFWWSSTPHGQAEAYVRELSYQDGAVRRVTLNRKYGFSVRCLKN